MRYSCIFNNHGLSRTTAKCLGKVACTTRPRFIYFCDECNGISGEYIFVPSSQSPTTRQGTLPIHLQIEHTNAGTTTHAHTRMAKYIGKPSHSQISGRGGRCCLERYALCAPYLSHVDEYHKVIDEAVDFSHIRHEELNGLLNHSLKTVRLEETSGTGIQCKNNKR